MVRTKYDEVAPTYDQRYERHAYPGISAAVLRFVGEQPRRVLEVGCGSGHWLALLMANGHSVMGVDASPGMLAKAHAKVSTAQAVLGHAEALPFDDGSFERVLIVNALHHFSDAPRALQEARRVVCAGGAILIIGLDPTSAADAVDAADDWYIYEYFPGTREHDIRRYPATSVIRDWLLRAGFQRCHSDIAERIEVDLPAREALASGALARHVTSQLSELSDQAYADGIAAIEAAAAAAEAASGSLHLRARLHLFATIAYADTV